MRILAIDPGYDRIGIAILDKDGSAEKLVYSDCKLTDKKLAAADRLSAVGTEIKAVIKEFQPAVLAIEKLYFSKNRKTALLVAQARGLILGLAAEAGLRIHEYSPQEVKIAVTGYGLSDKKQVTAMVSRLLNLDKKIKYDDEYDAIAIGLTDLSMGLDSKLKP